MNTGTITEIIGPIVDVHFAEGRPAIGERKRADGHTCKQGGREPPVPFAGHCRH